MKEVLAARPKAPALSRRLKLLAVRGEWRHRYRLYRFLSIALSLALLLAVPIAGLARFDLWRGAHLALGRPASAVEGLFAVMVGYGAFYLATSLINIPFGRLFCGWGCPVAQVVRQGEAQEAAGRSRKARARRLPEALLFDLALSAAILLWWVDPRVLLEGTPRARLAALGALGALAGALWLHGRFVRWSFCRKLCPIGLYYSVVAVPGALRIVFDRARGPCKDCRVCVEACPVDLDPMDLRAPIDVGGGLAIDGLPAHQHCLRCGDCVQACEHVFRREPEVDVPLRFRTGPDAHGRR